MAQNLQFDPVARDYVVVAGSPVETDDVATAGYYALAIPQNAWLYGVPGQGSLLYTLENAKRTPSVEQSFAAFANDAITRQLIQTGKATAVATQNVQATADGTSNKIGIVPAAQSVAAQLNFVPV